MGHGIDRIEEPRIVQAGLPGQRLEPRSRRQRRARLVEPDVTIAADSEQLQVDPAGIADRRLVRGAGGGDVGRLTVGPVHPPRIEVDPCRELSLDHRPVRLRMVGGQPDVLVEQEGGGGSERQLSAFVATSELVVHGQWGAARSQTEHRGRLPLHQLLDGTGDDASDLVGRRRDDDFHACCLVAESPMGEDCAGTLGPDVVRDPAP